MSPAERRERALALLGLPADADAEAVRRAFRAAALRWHPDKNPAPEAPERFAEVASALQELTRGSGSDAAAAGEGSGSDATAGEGSGSDAAAGESRGEIEICVSLREVRDGCVRHVAFEQPVRCAECSSAAQPAGCAGCAACGGAGHVYAERQFEVRVAPGAGHGQALRLPGAGPLGADAVLRVRHAFEPGVRLAADGATVLVDVPVSLAEALCGFERSLRLSHLDSELRVAREKYADPRAPIVVPGAGLHGAPARVRLRVAFPADGGALAARLSTAPYRAVLRRVLGADAKRA